jgi:hypothetical protein
VTQKPCAWDGDYRTFEALASGAAVAMDAPDTATGLGPPLRHGVHAVFLDPTNRTSFLASIRALVTAAPAVRYRLAARGHDLALRHHRSVSRVDTAVVALATAWQLWPAGDLAHLLGASYSATGAAQTWGAGA